MTSPTDPTKYIGTNVYLVNIVVRKRRPTSADYKQPETGKNYPIGCIWQVGKKPITGDEGELWMMSKIVANAGHWVPVSAGTPSTGPIITLSDDSSTLVYPTLSGDVQVAGDQGISTVSGTNVVTVKGIPSVAAATSSIANVGVSSFDSASFAVDADGFVTLKGGTQAIDSIGVDNNVAPGTDPVLPDAAGLITVTGAQVASGTTANAIRTNSTAANAYTIEIQRSNVAAASDTTKNGVAHFNNAHFTIDADGFVSIISGAIPLDTITVDAATAPGTNPVLADGSGDITVTGGQVAAGTVGANVIQTNSTAANSYAIEVQRSTVAAAADSTKNGVCHFSNAEFTVDADGFVQSIGYSTKVLQTVRTIRRDWYRLTGLSYFPNSDTAPQVSEGYEALTVSITPVSATSILQIDVELPFLVVVAGAPHLAIFTSVDTNAIGMTAADIDVGSATYSINTKTFVTSGTTSAINVSARMANKGSGVAFDVYINGNSAGRLFGGACCASITVTEYAS